MPQDFYDFWDFCKVLNPVTPEGTLLCIATVQAAICTYSHSLPCCGTVCTCSDFYCTCNQWEKSPQLEMQK